MPITLHPITDIGLDLDLVPERLQIGDSVQFVTKMTATQQKLENFAAAVLLAADDMNILGDQLENLDISSGYDVAVLAGFGGTMQEWLDTLVGPIGPEGEGVYELAQALGFIGSEAQFIDSLQGADGAPGVNGLNGIPGDGAGYTAPPWSVLTPTQLNALAPGSYVIADDGRRVELATDAIRYSYGPVADVAARDAILFPQHGDYVTVTADGNQYHYYDGITDAWIDTGSTTIPIVPPDPSLEPIGPTTSWNEVAELPSIATTADLQYLDWGLYPDGVYVEESGQTAYRDTDVVRSYQHLCGTSATAWLSKGWVNGGAIAGQAARVQAEVTADTYARFGFQVGATSANSLMVEIRPTQIRAYDSDTPEGSVIPVGIGDVIGLFRYTNGETRLNVNSVDVYTFARSDTSAINFYAYLFGIDDCLKYGMSGTDGNFLDPIQWGGFSDATVTEALRTEDYGWTYTDPKLSSALDGNILRAIDRANNQSPKVGGHLNFYPDNATVSLVAVNDNDLFSIMVLPGQSINVDSVNIAIAAGATNLEPLHFVKRSSLILRVGGNTVI